MGFIEEVKEKRKDIISAIERTEYKYFGDYEFTEAQHDAVEVLVDIAKAAVKLTSVEGDAALGFGMDKKIKALLIAALNVVDGRYGDVDTEDGSFATTSVENMIALEEAFCDAFNTNSDDVIASEIMPKIAEL